MKVPDKRFKEQAGGVLAPTYDDGCVAYFLSYVNPAANPHARLDAGGRILWDLSFTGGGAPNSPYANDGLALRPDGSVELKARLLEARGKSGRIQRCGQQHNSDKIPDNRSAHLLSSSYDFQHG